jgi:hypothetical protein
MRVLAAVIAAGALVCAGCNGGSGAPSSRTWHDNAVGLVAQLSSDVATVRAVPVTPDLSDQYALLVAYADMSGCSAMTSATGAPPGLQRVLARACPHLQRASALFTRGALRRAAREASLAEPALVSARSALRG